MAFSIKKNQKKIVFLLKITGFLLLFATFCYFRFYNLDKRIIFDWDQEHYAYEIKNIVKNNKFTLIGPRANNDKGFFLAPYFTYIFLPFYLLANLHPSGSVIFIIFYNCLFFFASFLIVKKLFGPTQAFLFLGFWTFNNLLVGYDIIPWWPILIPIGVIITWYWLYEIQSKNKVKDWFFLGITLGFFVNMHFQFIFIILFSLVYLAVLYKKVFSIKKVLFLFIGFLLMFTPLFLFDLRHNFLNTKLFLNFFVNKDGLPTDNLAWLPVFANFLEPITHSRSESFMIVFSIIIFLLSLILSVFSKKNRFFNISFAALWLLTPVFFSLYGKRPSEYYYVFLYPFIFIIIGESIELIKNRRLANTAIVGLLLGLVSMNLKTIKLNRQDNKFGLYYKDKAIKKLKTLTKNRKFNISFDTPLGANNGYMYLIDYYDIKQTGNWEKDPLFQIRIPPKKGDVVVDLIGIAIPKEYKK